MTKTKIEIIVTPGRKELAREGAAIFSQTAMESRDLRGRFAVAISGGSTPRPMHRMLVEEPFVSEIPWDITHIFWVDERCVPVDDPASNYGTARKDFLERLPIASANIHPMPADSLPEKGGRIYQKALQAFFQPEEGMFPVFDLLFLGMGHDGHTASLFPGHHALRESEKTVIPVKGGHPDVYRLTMTLPVINWARKIVFVIGGKDKAGILKSTLEDMESTLPARYVQPLNGVLTWLTDQDAASMLSKGAVHDAA